LFVSTISVKYQSKKNYFYAESKQAAEEAVTGSTLHYTIVRPTIVLGKESATWKSLSRLATRWIVFIPGTGRVMIQPVDVDDLCIVLNSIMKAKQFRDEVIEVGGPDKLSFQDFLERAHAHIYGGWHVILRIPIKPLLPILTFLEKLAPAFPISPGQLSAFYNDGSADPINSDQLQALKMKSVDQIVKELISNA
jgi:hypothetical protein